MQFTVLGGRGFVGRRLVSTLRRQGHEVEVPPRDDESLFHRDLGHVIYCVGLTADFDKHPAATVEAHCGLVSRIVEAAQFDHILYLSSTRLYDRLETLKANGGALLPMEPSHPRHLYDLSKALGENLCLCQKRAPAAVARLSGVFDWEEGAPGFLSEWLQRARHERCFLLDSASGIVRDYIHLDDVVDALVRISSVRMQGIFNVASGENVSNGELAAVFAEFGYKIGIARSTERQMLPVCDIEQLVALQMRPRLVRDVVRQCLRDFS